MLSILLTVFLKYLGYSKLEGLLYIYIYIYIYDRIGLNNNYTLRLIQESNESFFGVGEIWIQIPYLIIRDFTCWVSETFLW